MWLAVLNNLFEVEGAIATFTKGRYTVVHFLFFLNIYLNFQLIFFNFTHPQRQHTVEGHRGDCAASQWGGVL